MSDNFKYSLIKNDSGNFAIQSVVKSFNLDHVSEKDVVAFYNTFSQYASFDTGLLPLNGTGVLAIRTAGPHTQIVTQHAPGMYYINWGTYEGDHTAKTYYVAQPYRIVIGDFENGQLLGARMFYSPVPITNPSNLLYHVNLPNINCKGYRGNGVGWICLYHKDDWSSLPFNEKVSRFIERCSGVETYNDQNMSETDGPRFYAQNSKPDYIWDPTSWQAKSTEGFEWTLNDELWIPVLIKDMDHQDKHYADGEPLTLAMAMLGNYQAYYTDTNIPKMYNVVSRSDYSLDNNMIADVFKKSFVSSPVTYSHQAKDNPYNFTLTHREKNGSATLQLPLFSNDDEESSENDWMCHYCEDSFTEGEEKYTVYDNDIVCESCFNEYYVYVQSTNKYYHYEDTEIYKCSNGDQYYHAGHDTIETCPDCGVSYGASGMGKEQNELVDQYFYPIQDGQKLCSHCFDSYIEESELTTSNCFACSKTVITSVGWNTIYPTLKVVVPNPTLEDKPYETKYATFCTGCSSAHYVCPCGLVKNKELDQTANCDPTSLGINSEGTELVVYKCCASCLGPVSFDQDGNASANYKPQNEMFENYSKTVVEEKIYLNISSITQNINSQNDEPF